MTSAGAQKAICLACGSDQVSLWCKAGDPEYRTSDAAYAYLACAACAALSIDPVPSDRLSLIYPRNYYSYIDQKSSPLEAVKASLDRGLLRTVLKRLPGRALSVLDIGGGSGWMLTQARRADARVRSTTVLDINDAAEAGARAAGHEFVLSRIEDFAPSTRFDLIIMFNLIEHVARPGDMLEKVRDCLAPGGVVLLKTPNCDSLDARLFRRSYWGGLHSPRHWVLFTPESFVRLAQKAGLEVDRLQLTQGAPFWAFSALAWLERRKLVRVTPERPMYAHPLFAPLAAIFAAFDYVRAPFMRTSQMFVTLRRVE